MTSTNPEIDLKALGAAIKAWAMAQRKEEFKASARARRDGEGAR